MDMLNNSSHTCVMLRSLDRPVERPERRAIRMGVAPGQMDGQPPKCMIGATGWVMGGGSVRLDMLKHGREDTGIVRNQKPAFQHRAPRHAMRA